MEAAHVPVWARADVHVDAFQLHLERVHRGANQPDDLDLESSVAGSRECRIDVHTASSRSTLVARSKSSI
jgi:hypothetical protein